MALLRKVFKSENDRNLARLEKIAGSIEAKADFYKAKTDEELKETTTTLKQRISNGEKLEAILPDAYALVREASTRVLGMTPFHVQLLGAIALFQGRVAEMKTGEGKTLTVTMPAFLHALEGKGVHIVTVNEYLVSYQSALMSRVFNFLGLTVGVVLSNMDPNDKRKAYNCDITYGTNNELGFDYLRDNMVTRKQDRVARGYHFAIVDEVDSILIDEARTPLIISGKGMKSNETYKTAASFAKSMRKGDYEIDEKEKAIRLTEKGIAKAEKFFNVETLSDIKHIELNHHINNAMRAQFIMKKDNDYIVDGDEIIIVDEFTGRLMEGRKYSNGLHQAIEAKEGVEIKDENKTLATVTFQNFFRLYKKLSGMTGTAKTEELEFNKIYNLDVVIIPTNKPVIRNDYPDVVYKNVKGKFNAIVEEVKRVHALGRPILVGTISVEKSEQIAKELKKHKIKHFVLNAKNHKQESEIIAQAGRLGAVTIATNMAGRGTDILLGGNAEYMAKQRLREQGADEESLSFCTSLEEQASQELLDLRKKYKKYYNDYKVLTDKEKSQVIALGGLHIVGTERHESRRIDNQLRGRAGRQGDPGSSVFFVSMEDELLRRFGGETMQKVMSFLKMDENTPLQYKMLSKQIEGAQRRIEGFNFSGRHNVLKFDDVLNTQRNIVYKERNKVLDGENIHDEIVDMIKELSYDIVYDHIDEDKQFYEWDLQELNNALNGKVFPPETDFVKEEMIEDFEAEDLANLVYEEVIKRYEEKIEAFSKIGIKAEQLEGGILLRVVDSLWMDHIDFMNTLRNEIGLRAYGNHDPVVAYKQEGFEVFDSMVSRIREETALFLLHAKVDITPIIQAKKRAQEAANLKNNNTKPSMSISKKSVGRNDPCPCGSGKKYKNCHGKV